MQSELEKSNYLKDVLKHNFQVEIRKKQAEVPSAFEIKDSNQQECFANYVFESAGKRFVDDIKRHETKYQSTPGLTVGKNFLNDVKKHQEKYQQSSSLSPSIKEYISNCSSHDDVKNYLKEVYSQKEKEKSSNKESFSYFVFMIFFLIFIFNTVSFLFTGKGLFLLNLSEISLVKTISILAYISGILYFLKSLFLFSRWTRKEEKLTKVVLGFLLSLLLVSIPTLTFNHY